MKPLIIGVDPGSTSAVAGLGFEGEKVFVESRKNFPPRDMIAEIVKHGRPVVVASDKEKFPSTVEKIASSFGAYRYELESDMSSERKSELGEGENDHEEDAVAAARNAFRGLRDNIETIKELSEERPEDTAEIALKYFHDELTQKTEETEDESDEEEELEASDTQEDVSEVDVEALREENSILVNKVENLEEQVSDLQSEVEGLEDEASGWRSKYDRMRTEKRKEIMKERILTRKKAEIKDLEDEIRGLEEDLEKALIREKQYQKALHLIEKGGLLLPLVEKEVEEGPVVTASEELKNNLVDKGITAFHRDELEGVELSERFVAKKLPEKDLKDVIEEYRDAR